ncbi:MAG TPA: hypothetical protein VFZ97_01480 [Acidimicrobiales bacterium]
MPPYIAKWISWPGASSGWLRPVNWRSWASADGQGLGRWHRAGWFASGGARISPLHVSGNWSQIATSRAMLAPSTSPLRLAFESPASWLTSAS